MEIRESYGGTSIMKSTCLRDEVISPKIPKMCGLATNSAVYYIVGNPGSGKSHLCESVMKCQLKRVFDSVSLVCPRSSRSGYKKSYCKLLNPEKVYEELTMETLNKVQETIKETNDNGDEKKPRFSCLIIDDCASDLRNKHVQKRLLKMLQNHRHQRLTIFLISQNFQMLHKTLRDNVTILIQFKTGSLKEVKAINEEYLADYKPDEVDEILRYIFKEKYQFLLVNRRGRYICRSFNPLQIKTERDIIHEQQEPKLDSKSESTEGGIHCKSDSG